MSSTSSSTSTSTTPARRFTLQSSTLRSRSFWSGLAIIATASLQMAGIAPGPLTEGLLAILGGLAVIFVRDAIPTPTDATVPPPAAAPTSPPPAA